MDDMIHDTIFSKETLDYRVFVVGEIGFKNGVSCYIVLRCFNIIDATNGLYGDRIGEKSRQIGSVSCNGNEGKSAPQIGKYLSADGVGMSVSPNLNQYCGEI